MSLLSSVLMNCTLDYFILSGFSSRFGVVGAITIRETLDNAYETIMILKVFFPYILITMP